MKFGVGRLGPFNLRRKNKKGSPVKRFPLKGEQMGHQSKFFSHCAEVIHNLQCDPKDVPHGLCNRDALIIAVASFKAASKIYAPLFVLSALVSKRLWDPRYVLTKLLPSIIRSSLFISAIGSLWCRFACFQRQMFGSHYRFIYFLSPFLSATVGILLEKPERRNELTIYVCQQAVEVLFRSFESRGWVRPIKHGMTLLFSLAFGLLVYFQKHDEKCLGTSTRGLLRVAVGAESRPDILELRIANLYALLKKKFTGNATIEEFPKDRWCSHRYSCKSFALVGFCRSFLLGLGIRLAFTLVPLLLTPSKLLKNPRKIFNSSLFALGTFLGILSGGHRALACLLRRIRNKEDGWNEFLGGFIAGLSFVLNGSTEVGMYVASKAAEAIFRNGVKEGIVKPLPHGEILLFALGTATMFWVSIWEPHNLRPSYFKFLVKASGYKYGTVCKAFAPVREEFGVPSPEVYYKWKEKVAPFLKNC